MDGRRSALVADIDHWTVCVLALRRTLDANGAAVDEGRAMIARGDDLVDAIGAMHTATRFLDMSTALADFELARFRLRSSLISTALAEGLTAEELVETLGVPAELAGKVFAELRHGPGTAPA